MTLTHSNIPFELFVANVETAFDTVVTEGTDHELFIAGYLSGHFSLVVSHAQQLQEYHLELLYNRMKHSLNNAFADNELIAADQSDVWQLWNKLYNDFYKS